MEEMETKTILSDALKELFPSMKVVKGKYIAEYVGVKDEYNLLKYGVAVRSLMHYSKIFIHGKDSESLLKRLATNKIVDLNVLEWVKTLFINSYGKIIDRTMLLKFEDYFILIGSNSEEGKLLKWIKRFIMRDDISLKNVEEDYALFEILGAQAESFISMVLGEKYSELNERNILRVQVEDFFVHGLRVVDVNNINKFVILIESKYAVRMLKVLENMKSVYDFGMVGEEAYDIFRIEHGIPIAPNELYDDVSPVEVNLLDEVCNEKDGFIGQNLMNSSADNLGKLVKVYPEKFIEKREVKPELFDKTNTQVGVITSLKLNPVDNKAIGLGFIINNVDVENNVFHIKDSSGIINISVEEIRVEDIYKNRG